MKKYVFYVVVVLFSFSCTTYQYVAPQNYIPLSEKKGDITFNVGTNNLQVGYTVTDNFGVFLTGNYRNLNEFHMFYKENDGSPMGYERSNIVNLGTNFYKYKDNFSYEVLLSAGMGHLKFNNIIDLNPNYNFLLNSDKLNFYIQPNIGYKYKNELEVGAFTKFNYNNYYNIKTSCKLGERRYMDTFDEFFLNKSRLDLYFIEPGLFVKYGDQYIKGCAQISRSFSLTNNDVKYRSVNFYFSVYITIFKVRFRQEFYEF